MLGSDAGRAQKKQMRVNQQEHLTNQIDLIERRCGEPGDEQMYD
jgi:hypothetical protein